MMMVEKIIMMVMMIILMKWMTKITKKHTSIMTFDPKLYNFPDYFFVKKGLKNSGRGLPPPPWFGQCPKVNILFYGRSPPTHRSHAPADTCKSQIEVPSMLKAANCADGGLVSINPALCWTSYERCPESGVMKVWTGSSSADDGHCCGSDNVQARAPDRVAAAGRWNPPHYYHPLLLPPINTAPCTSFSF